MTASVPDRRASIDTSRVRGGVTVTGRTWRDTALLTNHVLGRGAQLVAAYCPDVTLTAGVAYDFSFYVAPRYQAFERIWTLNGYSTGAAAVVNVTPPTGSAIAWSVTSELTRPPWRCRESLGAQSATAGAVVLRVAPVAVNIVLTQVSCWEVPRKTLVTNVATDRGSDVELFSPGQLIDSTSVACLAGTLADETAIGRRAALAHWSVPYEADDVTSVAFAKQFTATTWTSGLSLAIPILGRKIGRSDVTTGPIDARVQYWWADGVSSGELRFVSAINGNSATVTLGAGTTPAWSGTPAAFTVDCEDLASTDGRQTSGTPAWDTVMPQFRRTNGSAKLYWSALAVNGL